MSSPMASRVAADRNPGSPSNPQPAKFVPPRLPAGAGSSSFYENSDYSNVWLEEFLSHEKACNEAIAKADAAQYTAMPGGANVLSRSANRLLQKQSPAGGKGVSELERQRLAELRKSLQNATTAAKPKKKKGLKKLGIPYVDANSKLSRVLKRRKPKTGSLEDMQASQLNAFYKLVTRETSAAIVLQSQCRRVLATEYVNRLALEKREATRIQCFVRASFARRVLRRLKEEKERATAVRAQFVRTFVARCRRRKKIKLERNAAILCQSAVRMFAAKQVARLERLQQSWELNQIRWRAISIRLSWANLRINFFARQIQSVVRRKLAKARVSSMFADHTEAAIGIQSVWRRYLAQQQKTAILYELAVETQCDKIRLLASEQQYWKERVEEVAKPAKQERKQELETQKANLEGRRREKEQEIHALESHYRDQLELQKQLTPRAIAGGWEEQVAINLKDTREWITQAKLDFFFDIKKKLHSVSEELETLQGIEDDAQASLVHFSQWQQAEQDRLWDSQRNHASEVEEKEMRKRIRDEQLKWEVDFRMPSGKPDKRRPLHHRPSDDDDEHGSWERVQRLMEAMQAKTDQFQSALHVANTFRPFAPLESASWLDSLAANDHEEPSHQPTTFPEGMSDGSRRRQQRKPTGFPKNLPFGLMDKIRKERAATRPNQQRAL